MHFRCTPCFRHVSNVTVFRYFTSPPTHAEIESAQNFQHFGTKKPDEKKRGGATKMQFFGFSKRAMMDAANGGTYPFPHVSAKKQMAESSQAVCSQDLVVLNSCSTTSVASGTAAVISGN